MDGQWHDQQPPIGYAPGPGTPPPPPPPIVGGRAPRRARWAIALAVALPLAARIGFRALNSEGDGGSGTGGECADLVPVVDVKGHTEQAADQVLFPGQYDIVVHLTVTNPGDDAIQIGSIDVAMAGAPDARVYGGGDQGVLEGGETRSFDVGGTILLDPPLLPVPDESSANVQWFYEDAGDYAC